MTAITMRKNVVKEKLKQGKPSVGAWIEIGHPDVPEIFGKFGFDWLMFDTEHAPYSVETVQILMQSMSGSHTLPMVRVAWNDPVLIKRALDIGAYGILVPMVNNGDEALRAVRACRYPLSGGTRGYGPRRASSYYIDEEQYINQADRDTTVAVQIETAAGLENIDEVLAVQGVDICFVGPYDLSMSMGIFRQFGHSKFSEALDIILDASKKHEVAPGIDCNIENINERISQGFQFVSLGTDTDFLIRACKTAMSKVVGWTPTENETI